VVFEMLKLDLAYQSYTLDHVVKLSFDIRPRTHHEPRHPGQNGLAARGIPGTDARAVNKLFKEEYGGTPKVFKNVAPRRDTLSDSDMASPTDPVTPQVAADARQDLHDS
jgi:hypothetical protein